MNENIDSSEWVFVWVICTKEIFDPFAGVAVGHCSVTVVIFLYTQIPVIDENFRVINPTTRLYVNKKSPDLVRLKTWW